MLKLVRYNESFYNCSDIWFWVDEEDCLKSPIFETELEAKEWLNKRN